jgi:hypothetical protein
VPKRVATRKRRVARYKSKEYRYYEAAYYNRYCLEIMAEDLYTAVSRTGFARRFLDACNGVPQAPKKVYVRRVPEFLPYRRHARYPVPEEWLVWIWALPIDYYSRRTTIQQVHEFMKEKANE